MNFDGFWKNDNNRGELFGKEYADLPPLPFDLGGQLAVASTQSDEEYVAVVGKVIDYVFGSGTWAEWCNPDNPRRPSSRQLTDIIIWIREDYDPEAVARVRAASRKKVEGPEIPSG